MFTRTILFCAALAANTLAHGADSDIDTSFGIFSTGHNVVPINGGGGNGDTVADVLVAPDSSLFLVGTSDLAGGQSRITVVHLLANGQLDTNFGTNGHYVVPSVSATASSAAFAANGDILVGATRHTAGNDDFTVCRVRGAGVAQFGNTGLPCITLAFDLGGTLQDTARDIVLLAGGRIALIGSAAAGNGAVEAAIAIINDNGTPDAGFSPGGKRHWLPNGYSEVNLYAGVRDFDVIQLVGDAKEQGSPRLGAFSAFVNTSTGTHHNDNIDYLGDANSQAFYRDLVLDDKPGFRLFAAGGVLQGGKYRGVVTHVKQFDGHDTDWDFGNGFSTINAGESVQLTRIVQQNDGKLLVAGMLQETGFTGSSLFVGRYNANGSLDVGTFNLLQGYREIDFQMPGHYDYGAVLALQFGQPVLAGSVQASGSNTDYDFGVARLRNDLIFANRFGSSPQDD
jgi:uncharacterized delta-60 repeat protein